MSYECRVQLGAFAERLPLPIRVTIDLDDYELSPVQLQRAETALVLLESSSDEASLLESARALGQMQRAAQAYAVALSKRLADKRVEVRRIMAWALAQIGGQDSQVIELLAEALADSDSSVQTFLQTALCSTGIMGAKILVAKLMSDDVIASASAASVLVQMGGATAADALATKLPEADSRALLRIIQALAKLKVAAVRPHLDALAAALQDGDALVRAAVVDALGDMGRAAGPQTARLSTALSDSEEAVRIAALRALGRIAKASLGKDPLKHFEPESWTLPNNGIVVMVSYLRHPGATQVQLALETLKDMGAVGAAIISSQLFICREDTKQRCIETLTQMNPTDDDKRPGIVAGLLSIGAAALRLHLNHPNPRVRSQLCLALGRCGKHGRGHGEALEALGKTDVEQVRRAAKQAVRQMGFREGGYADIQEMKNDSSLRVGPVPMRERRETDLLVDNMQKLVEQINQLLEERATQLPAQAKATSCFCFRR